MNLLLYHLFHPSTIRCFGYVSSAFFRLTHTAFSGYFNMYFVSGPPADLSDTPRPPPPHQNLRGTHQAYKKLAAVHVCAFVCHACGYPLYSPLCASKRTTNFNIFFPHLKVYSLLCACVYWMVLLNERALVIRLCSFTHFILNIFFG